MKTITYQTNPTLDKSEWPPGEWDDEPDKVQWEDKATGLPCLAVRNRMGAWCGYVGVPEEHRFHGIHYDAVTIGGEGTDYDDEHYPPAHGGLTFANPCMEDLPEDQGICHVPDSGEPDDVWWLGFDCNHMGDLAPGMMRFHQEILDKIGTPSGWTETYKPLSYVQDQCADLAAWLKAAA